MDLHPLIASLQDAVPAAQFESAPSVDLQTTMYVSRDELPAVARALRDRPELAFTFLAEVTAVDVWPREPRFELVYILVSIAHRLRLRLKGKVGPPCPKAAVTCLSNLETQSPFYPVLAGALLNSPGSTAKLS